MSSAYRQRGFNTLRPRQNGRHFADDIFKCIFLNENVWIPIKISLKFVPKGQINNIPTLVQEWLGADQATSHYLNQWWFIYWRIYASLGLNELRKETKIPIGITIQIISKSESVHGCSISIADRLEIPLCGSKSLILACFVQAWKSHGI